MGVIDILASLMPSLISHVKNERRKDMLAEEKIVMEWKECVEKSYRAICDEMEWEYNPNAIGYLWDDYRGGANIKRILVILTGDTVEIDDNIVGRFNNHLFFEICDHHSVNNLYNNLSRLNLEGKIDYLIECASLGLESVETAKDALPLSSLYLEDKVPESGNGVDSDSESIDQSQLVYDDNSSADTLYEVAESMYDKGSYWEAVKALDKASIKYDEEKSVSGQAKTHHFLGKIYKLLYEIPRAYLETREAIAKYTSMGNKAQLADSYITMADVYILMAEYDNAISRIDEAKDLYTELPSRLGSATALFFECKYLFYSGKCNSEQEKETFFKTLDRAERFYCLEDSSLGIANVWNLRAAYYSKVDDYKNAISSLRKAEEQYELLGDRFQQKKVILAIIGKLMLHRDYEGVLKELEHAEKYCDEAEDIHFVADIQYYKGEYCYIFCSGPNDKNYSKALSAINDAVRLYRKVNDAIEVANSLKIRGDIFQINNDFCKAEEDYTEAEKIYAQKGSELGKANVLCSRAKLHRTFRNVEISVIEKEYQCAIESYKKIGSFGGLVSALESFAQLYCDEGRWSEAEMIYEEALSLNKYDVYNKDTYISLMAMLKKCKKASGDLVAAERIQNEIYEIMEESK